MKAARIRLRVRYDSVARSWYAVALDSEGHEVARSPHGSEHDAERHMENYKRFGAWRAS